MSADGAVSGVATLSLVIGKLLLLGWVALHVVAYFSMADSMRRQAAISGFPLEIGSGTLFFFTMYYLQALMRWLARWKDTGQASPAAPKAVFWVLSLVLLFVIGTLAAIAIPEYGDYRVRTQVSEGAVLADGAKQAMAKYYSQHHTLPPDNLAAGLPHSALISGRYVSSVNVAGGAVTVAFDTIDADRRIWQQTLVFFPVIERGEIRWDCRKYSTVPDRDLPVSCRN
jgi:Tfp pilus assembly major pilin PilA